LGLRVKNERHWGGRAGVELRRIFLGSGGGVSEGSPAVAAELSFQPLFHLLQPILQIIHILFVPIPGYLCRLPILLLLDLFPLFPGERGEGTVAVVVTAPFVAFFLSDRFGSREGRGPWNDGLLAVLQLSVEQPIFLKHNHRILIINIKGTINLK
jgi:hypothetical protein